jgi:hypothetical protein
MDKTQAMLARSKDDYVFPHLFFIYTASFFINGFFSKSKEIVLNF